MLPTGMVFGLARLWNILAILLLSAFVNLITQLPWTDWPLKPFWLKTFAASGTFLFLASGVSSQWLFERISVFLIAASGSSREAIKLVDTKNKLSLRLHGTITLVLSAAGVAGWVMYRAY